MKMRTSDLECIGDRLHREASFGCDKSRKLGFFDSDFARASRKILDFHRFAAEHPLKLTDALFEPADLRAPDNCSSDPTAAAPPSVINRRQRYSRLGATPRRRATDDTVSPGWKLSSMICSFCSVVQCRRRTAPVISSIRW